MAWLLPSGQDWEKKNGNGRVVELSGDGQDSVEDSPSWVATCPSWQLGWLYGAVWCRMVLYGPVWCWFHLGFPLFSTLSSFHLYSFLPTFHTKLAKPSGPQPTIPTVESVVGGSVQSRSTVFSLPLWQVLM